MNTVETFALCGLVYITVSFAAGIGWFLLALARRDPVEAHAIDDAPTPDLPPVPDRYVQHGIERFERYLETR